MNVKPPDGPRYNITAAGIATVPVDRTGDRSDDPDEALLSLASLALHMIPGWWVGWLYWPDPPEEFRETSTS